MVHNDQIWRLAVKGRLHGQRTINTFYFHDQAEEPGDEVTAATTLQQNFRTQVAAAWSAAVSEQWESGIVEVKKVRIEKSITFIQEWVGGAIVGTVEEPSLPTSVSVVISRKTLVPGRDGMGRVYIAGCPESFETGSLLNIDGLTAFGDLAQAFSESFGAGDRWLPVLASRGGGYVGVDLFQWLLRTPLRSQRRRQFGVGE